MTESLTTGVTAWLEKSGYPLELAISKTLRELDYECFKSVLYEDVETGKSREIDLLAETGEGDRDIYLEGKLVIECKKTTKPFVILSDDPEQIRIGELVLHDEVRMDRNGKFIVDAQNLPTKLNLFNRKAMPVLGSQTRIGYSIVKAHSRDDSEIYGEVLKLAKAYDNVVTRESERMEKLRNDSSGTVNYEKKASIALPLLVVDGPLTDVYVNKKGEIVVTEIEIGILNLYLSWRDLFNPTISILVVKSSLVRQLGIDFKKFLKKIVERRPETDEYLIEKVQKKQ